MSESNHTKQLIANRLLEIIKALGFKNEHEFSKALGYKRAENIYNATSGDRFPGIPLLVDIANTFENVNIDYVLTGIGGVFKEKATSDAVAEGAVKLSAFDALAHRISKVETMLSNANRTISKNEKMITGAVKGLSEARQGQLVTYSILVSFQEYWLEELARLFPGGTPAEVAKQRIAANAWSILKDTRQEGMTVGGRKADS